MIAFSMSFDWQLLYNNEMSCMLQKRFFNVSRYAFMSFPRVLIESFSAMFCKVTSVCFFKAVCVLSSEQIVFVLCFLEEFEVYIQYRSWERCLLTALIVKTTKHLGLIQLYVKVYFLIKVSFIFNTSCIAHINFTYGYVKMYTFVLECYSGGLIKNEKDNCTLLLKVAARRQ